MIMEAFGTATAGTTTTITDTSKNYIVNALLNKQIIFTTGTGQRIVSTITANSSTRNIAYRRLLGIRKISRLIQIPIPCHQYFPIILQATNHIICQTHSQYIFVQ
jgi:hypothetical protein